MTDKNAEDIKRLTKYMDMLSMAIWETYVEDEAKKFIELYEFCSKILSWLESGKPSKTQNLNQNKKGV